MKKKKMVMPGALGAPTDLAPVDVEFSCVEASKPRLSRVLSQLPPPAGASSCLGCGSEKWPKRPR